MEPRRISVVLITQDEEQLMERALRSCLPFADELVVVDGGSRDGSVARARRLGCTVYENPWPGFAKQRNFGLSKARHEWVFLIDSDEVVEEDLARSLVAWKADPHAHGDAFALRRRRDFFGEWLNHHLQIRLVRRHLRYKDMLVHEKFPIDARQLPLLDGTLAHRPFRTLADEADRENLYSTLAAEQAARTRRFSLFRLLFRPPARFLRNYIARRLFRKGMAGFTQSVMWAYHEFLVEAKLYEREWRARATVTAAEPELESEPVPAERRRAV